MTKRRHDVKKTTPPIEEAKQGAPVPPPVKAEPAAGTEWRNRPTAGFPVVDIDASAGGLATFEAFFSGMPADIDPGKDPPFSKLDLISCRNLQIYMGGNLRKKLIPLFHYAMNPDGFLFPGTSEFVGDFGERFATLDRKSKLYRRKADLPGAQRAALGRFLPPMVTQEEAIPRAVGKPAFPGKLPLRELTEQTLLQQVAPAAALINLILSDVGRPVGHIVSNEPGYRSGAVSDTTDRQRRHCG
jgi:hypothetical protein